MIHEQVEKGEALTSEWLNNAYYELTELYHGPGMKPTEDYWFGVVAGAAFLLQLLCLQIRGRVLRRRRFFSQRILADESQRDQYLGFLSAGGSKDPLDTVRDAGLDIADPSTLEQSFKKFKTAIADLKKLMA